MTPRQNRPTINQVAAAAGVTKSSVSRAFTRPEMLSPETVRKISAAAERLGYVPNHSARALSTGRHGNIALIVPDVANPFFPPLISAAQSEADRFDYCVFLGNSNEDPGQEDKLIGRFAGQVEGFVLVSSRLSDDQIVEHAARRPVVLINRDVKGIPRILIDSAAGVAEAVSHLATLGHRKLVYVGGPHGSWSNKQRRIAVRRAAKDHGLEVAVISNEFAAFESGRKITAAALATGATAAIAFDDLTAQGMLAELADMGVAVPADFAVVGCDDVLGAATYPPLTTVSNRSVEAGKAALNLLMEILQNNAIRDVRYVLDTNLVIRKTTGQVKAGKRSEAALGSDANRARN
ncbi:LacI family DNA-binding transcriptional regulator [Devosia sp. PTR5]|uniref:LacI family DNA-binding transcriptional regulator n=1 Tax=Devosia oryzisoli TaxID=2774138 RepID=A0A927FQT4_9HYPH|nr:LacI family DNA-binding transcriptional regulator [Devosia oryzisoli]MBD8064550.1 LacI family DNA-binding transcriptional regulator [Devosia oryzisoli]